MMRTNIFYKALGTALFFFILSLSYTLDLHNQYSNYLDTHLISRGLKTNIETLKHDYAQKDAYSSAFIQMQKTYNQEMAVFPPIKNINTTLNAIKTAGEKNNLQFESITPGTSAQKDFYLEVPVQITLVGSYQSILTFMQTTSSWNGPFFIWKDWTLSHQNKPKTTVLNETQNNDLLQMHVNAIFFYMP